jgi:hypothetical protein
VSVARKTACPPSLAHRVAVERHRGGEVRAARALRHAVEAVDVAVAEGAAVDRAEARAGARVEIALELRAAVRFRGTGGAPGGRGEREKEGEHRGAHQKPLVARSPATHA